MKIKKILPVTGIVMSLFIIVFVILGRGSGNISATLEPSEDNHWLKLNVKEIEMEADGMEYELIYELPDGRIQGVPGSVKLEGDRMIERDILLGTESSGVYYYDEGVEKGTISLRFLNGDNVISEYEKEWILENLKKDPSIF